jgi:hypothetical protein
MKPFARMGIVALALTGSLVGAPALAHAQVVHIAPPAYVPAASEPYGFSRAAPQPPGAEHENRESGAPAWVLHRMRCPIHRGARTTRIRANI